MCSRDSAEILATRTNRPARAFSVWRRVRGCLGIGVFWGGLGAFIGGSIAGARILLGDPIGGLLEIMAWTGGLGAGIGLGFSALLAAVQGRRGLERLSGWRSAALGALAGAVSPVGLMMVVLLLYPEAGTSFWGALLPSLVEVGMDLFWMSASMASAGGALAAVTTEIAKNPTRRLSFKKNFRLRRTRDRDLLEGGA